MSEADTLWEGANEGAAVPPLLAQAGLTEVVKYIGATWSFVPIFYDPEAARAQGLGGTIVPGPMKLALLSKMLSDWLGDAGLLRSIRCAHRRLDRPGLLRCQGAVLRRYEHDGERLLDLEIWIENERGERSGVGGATVALF